MRTLAIITTLLALIFALGCGGGDEADPGIGGGSGGSNNLAGSLTPDEPNPGSDSVSMQPGATSGNLVVIECTVTDPTDVFGVAFDVTFDPAMAEYVSWAAGRLLEQSGQTVAYQVSNSAPGRLVVGASRAGSATGATASGDQVVIELTFRVLQPGSSTVGYGNGSLLDAHSPPQVIGGVTWHAATLLGN
jgi:hypothetical protein